MTEDEAKTKWCPMVRSSDTDQTVDNAYISDRNPSYSRCIGSDCMMWRWKLDVRFAETSKTDGYCGLAK